MLYNKGTVVWQIFNDTIYYENVEFTKYGRRSNDLIVQLPQETTKVVTTNKIANVQ